MVTKHSTQSPGIPAVAFNAELQRLAEQINASHDNAIGAAQTAVEHARQCGMLLLEARSKVAHGEWLPWLKENCRVGERHARRYMRVAKNLRGISKSDLETDLTIAEAARLNVDDETRRLPKLSETHSLRCLGEDDTFAIIVPVGGRYYYVGIARGISEEDCIVDEWSRGLIDSAVEIAIFENANFQPVGEWEQRPLSGDDLRFVMEAKNPRQTWPAVRH